MPRTLQCLPTSLCSWNYRVLGGERGESLLQFNLMSERGSIEFGGGTFTIGKHGMWRTRWVLQLGEEVVVEADRPNVFFRKFELRGPEIEFDLKAISGFTRSFNILSGERILGTIAAVHPFTRRATIECDDEVPELIQLFAFWLVAITWRRAAQNHS